jgi:hypothetical protein
MFQWKESSNAVRVRSGHESRRKETGGQVSCSPTGRQACRQKIKGPAGLNPEGGGGVRHKYLGADKLQADRAPSG